MFNYVVRDQSTIVPHVSGTIATINKLVVVVHVRKINFGWSCTIPAIDPTDRIIRLTRSGVIDAARARVMQHIVFNSRYVGLRTSFSLFVMDMWPRPTVINATLSESHVHDGFDVRIADVPSLIVGFPTLCSAVGNAQLAIAHALHVDVDRVDVRMTATSTALAAASDEPGEYMITYAHAKINHTTPTYRLIDVTDVESIESTEQGETIDYA